jgi:3-deoxy-D-manno-octulosonic-acid transferase
VIVGPSMENFSAIMERLRTHQAVREVSGPAELAPALREVLADSLEAQKMGRRAQELIEESSGCTQRTVDALAPFLC